VTGYDRVQAWGNDSGWAGQCLSPLPWVRPISGLDIEIIAFLVMQYHFPDTVGTDIDKTYGGEIDLTIKTLSHFFPPPVGLPSFNTIPGLYAWIFHPPISIYQVVSASVYAFDS
jgi:hypothetical protein